jgi:hypothetical protein
MSMQDFHAKLVAAADQNPLFAALRKLSQADNIQQLMAEDPGMEWSIWGTTPNPTPVPGPAGA